LYLKVSPGAVKYTCTSFRLRSGGLIFALGERSEDEEKTYKERGCEDWSRRTRREEEDEVAFFEVVFST
jgi:hypothetical protein